MNDPSSVEYVLRVWRYCPAQGAERPAPICTAAGVATPPIDFPVAEMHFGQHPELVGVEEREIVLSILPVLPDDAVAFEVRMDPIGSHLSSPMFVIQRRCYLLRGANSGVELARGLSSMPNFGQEQMCYELHLVNPAVVLCPLPGLAICRVAANGSFAIEEVPEFHDIRL